MYSLSFINESILAFELPGIDSLPSCECATLVLYRQLLFLSDS